MAFEINGNEITTLKDCKTCSHFEVCALYKQMQQVSSNSIFSQMNGEYGRNNILSTFEKNVKCQYYKYRFDADCVVGLDSDNKIIEYLIREKRPEDCNSWTHSMKNNSVTFFKNTGNEVLQLTDFLSQFKILPLQ